MPFGFRPKDSFRLRFASMQCAAGVIFDDITLNRATLRATLGPRFNVNVCHVFFLSLNASVVPYIAKGTNRQHRKADQPNLCTTPKGHFNIRHGRVIITGQKYSASLSDRSLQIFGPAASPPTSSPHHRSRPSTARATALCGERYRPRSRNFPIRRRLSSGKASDRPGSRTGRKRENRGTQSPRIKSWIKSGVRAALLFRLSIPDCIPAPHSSGHPAVPAVGLFLCRLLALCRAFEGALRGSDLKLPGCGRAPAPIAAAPYGAARISPCVPGPGASSPAARPRIASLSALRDHGAS